MAVDSTAVELTSGLAALADPVRLRLVGVLAGGGRCVCDLQEKVPVPANLLSYHLRVLREAGLVTATRRGRLWSPCTLVDRFPLCRIYIKNVKRSLKTHRAHFPQPALFPDAVVIALDVVEYRGPGLFGIPPQMLVDELFLDSGIK